MSRDAYFDDHTDIAALVYNSDEDPDAVLYDFSRTLIAEGRRVVGLVQSRTDCQIVVTLLPTGERIELSQNLGRHSQSCSIDTDRLARAAVHLHNCIAAGSDLVVVNRFGKLEAEGKGLIDELAEAVAADMPVVIAVPQHRFADWLNFSGGMSVKLACSTDSLRQWWSGIAKDHAIKRASASTYCEFAK